jgi:hypothetical protein
MGAFGSHLVCPKFTDAVEQDPNIDEVVTPPHRITRKCCGSTKLGSYSRILNVQSAGRGVGKGGV